MEKSEVIRIRDIYKSLPIKPGLEVICDNMIYFRDWQDILHWDDDRGILTVVKQNENYHHGEGKELEFNTCDYATIQFINFNCGKKSVERIVKDLNFTEDEIKQVLDFVKAVTTIKL